MSMRTPCPGFKAVTQWVTLPRHPKPGVLSVPNQAIHGWRLPTMSAVKATAVAAATDAANNGGGGGNNGGGGGNNGGGGGNNGGEWRQQRR